MTDAAIAQAASLLLQTPPGQTSKVYHDLRALLESSGHSNAAAQLKKHAEPVLEQYNTEQLITVKPPVASSGDAKEAQAQQPIIIARAAEVPGKPGRYADPGAHLSYSFDHLRLAASDPQPLLVNKRFEQVRTAIDSKVSKYVKDHFQDGVTSTFAVIKPDPSAALRKKHAAAVNEEKAEEKRKQAAAEAAETPTTSTAVEGTLGKDKEDEEAAESKEEPSEEKKEDDDTKKASGEGNDDDESSAKPEKKEDEDDPVEAVKAAEAVEADAKEAEKTAPQDKEEGIEKKEEEEQEPQGEPTYVTHIVANRYNLANFWAGRWRSSYTYKPSSKGASASKATLSASIQVQVHYFEDGNVQLAASRPQELELNVSSSIGGQADEDAKEVSTADVEKLATAIASAIKKHEQEYHLKLNEAYSELSEKAFKAMRRPLPVTKQKIDWDKAVTYKLATALGTSNLGQDEDEEK